MAFDIESIIKKNEWSRKYSLNENYFDEIDTEEKAYILGFLYADGNVSKKKYTIQISQSIKDGDILDKISSNSSTPIKIYKNSFKRNYKLFSINSKHMVLKLRELGLNPAKTFTITYPKWIKLNLQRHFIRGYFDGDGCIYYNNKRLEFILVGRLNFIQNIQNILMKECDLKQIKIRKERNVYRLNYCGNIQCLRIFDWLYKNSNIYLERKYNKFLEAKLCLKK
jgi:intein/homing endonuclease